MTPASAAHVPRVLLAAPPKFGLNSALERNLRHHGFDVTALGYDSRHWPAYPHWKYRLINAFLRNIARDKGYKKRLKLRWFWASVKDQILQAPIDYALFLRTDEYSVEFLRHIKSHVKEMVGFQWDGLDVFPDTLETVREFDRFYVFDPEDVARYPEHGLNWLNNFYFDDDMSTLPITHDFYFVGTANSLRVEQMQQFSRWLGDTAYSAQLLLYARAPVAGVPDCVRVISQMLDYEANLTKMKASRCLIDLLDPKHSGLSLRVFEALGHDKKLITTNALVKKTDFYHPDNIFYWGGDDLSGLQAFMQTPYRPLEPEIKARYGFKNWLTHVFRLPENFWTHIKETS